MVVTKPERKHSSDTQRLVLKEMVFDCLQRSASVNNFTSRCLMLTKFTAQQNIPLERQFLACSNVPGRWKSYRRTVL